jgi:hypothetical protein
MLDSMVIGSTIVIDSSSIMGLLGWVVVIVVVLVVILWALGGISGFMVDVGQAISKPKPKPTNKKPEISAGKLLLYVLIETVLTWGVAIALLATNNGPLMFIAVVSFFAGIYGWHYLANKYDVTPINQSPKK